MVSNKEYLMAPWWKWIVGMPADFWLVNEGLVAQFIRTNKLKPVSQESLLTNVGVTGAIAKTSRKRTPAMDRIDLERTIDIDHIINIYGGKRVPHLHYRGKIYLLNQRQWERFSSKIIKEFTAKLAKAKTVNFEHFMEMTDVMNLLQ